MLNMLEYKVS